MLQLLTKPAILSPEEIREIRENLGLSQRGLAILLGWSSSTIARYESGFNQSPAHQTILLMVRDNREFVKGLFYVNGEKLARQDLKRISSILREAI